jgi:glycosyltransferase involved in cell wall biosynthesis
MTTGAEAAGDDSHRARNAANSKPRLLFLSQSLPFPPDGGVHIRSYNTLRLLSRDFDITALCFFRATERTTPGQVQSGVTGLQRIARTEAFPIPQEHSRLRLLFDHLVSVLTWRAYTIRLYESRQFRRRLAELVTNNDFQLVHLDSLDLAAYLPMLAGLPIVCVHHNVESALLRRRAAATPGLSGAYIKLQAHLTQLEEERWCGKVNLNVAVSEKDRESLQALCPTGRFMVVPNGVDTNTFQPGTLKKKGVVFVGGYSWQPNRDAMEYFCKEILPLLRASGCDGPITWVGRVAEAVRREYAQRYGIELTGYVDDVRPAVQGAACYVAPLRVGGGTRLKILDAWAMGMAVVSTSVGCEGLEARDGDNILIRDTAADFAEAVRDVVTNRALREKLGNAARMTAELLYDWEVIGRPMLSRYLDLLV